MAKALITTLALIFITNALLAQNPTYQFDGQSSGDWFGESVAVAGDINNDGFDDVLIGAAGADHNGTSSGSAYIYSGEDGTLLYQFNGNAGDSLGAAVAAAGDVNGDGYADVIIGAPHASNNGSYSGSVYIYSGVDGTLLYQRHGSAGDFFGSAVAMAGDVNGDGVVDVIVGAPRTNNNGAASGSAYVYSGADGMLLQQWHGQNADDHFGTSVSAAGDVNGDSFDDVIVGAHYVDINGDNSGSAYIYSVINSAPLYQWHGQNIGDLFGSSVAAAGDLNSDGFDDVIIGAPLAANSGNYSGCIYIYSGVDGTLLHQWFGQNSYDFFGVASSAVSDVNNDGVDDIIVGASGADNNGNDSGSAYVFSGASGALLYQWDGQNAGDSFGAAVSAANCVIIGAYLADSNGSDSGSAYVYSHSSAPDYTISNLNIGQNAVFDIAGAPPFSQIHIAYSTTGSGPTTTSFGVVDMSLPINLLLSGTADHLGNASFSRLVPLGAAGITLYTQAKCGSLLSNSLTDMVQ